MMLHGFYKVFRGEGFHCISTTQLTKWQSVCVGRNEKETHWTQMSVTHAINFHQIHYGFHRGIENGYDWVDLCQPLNESQLSVLPQCLTLSADAASDQACLRWYVCLSASHRAKDTIKLLQKETLDFTGPDLWPPNSPDLNPVDYKVWGVMQQRVYKCH